MKNAKASKRMFPDLGIGVGLRAEYNSLFQSEIPKTVDWLEAITENYLPSSQNKISRPLEQLERLRTNTAIVFHGVSLNIGSADSLDMAYLKRLKTFVERMKPAWISDHLCWTGIDGVNYHDLYPVLYTEEALRFISEKILRVQDFLGCRILMENLSSYAEFEASEMFEWEFVAEISKRSDCGLLLDINNVYVNSVNHSFSPLTYLKNLPIERIGQIHLAGHTTHEKYLVDTHDEPVCEEVWELYNWVLKNLGVISAMVERDDQFPEWAVLEQEIIRARRIRDENKFQAENSGPAFVELAKAV